MATSQAKRNQIMARREEVARMRAAGRPVYGMARHFGVTEATIRHDLRALAAAGDIPPLRQSGGPGPCPDLVAAVEKAIDECTSIAQLARRMGVPVTKAQRVAAQARARRGMPPGESQKRLADQVRDALLGGMSVREASAHVECSISTARRVSQELRREGLLPPMSVATRPPATDALGALLQQEPEPFRRWLVDQIPDGGTVNQIIIAILRDAYFEEASE
jgi:transposase-like protein